MGSADGRDTSVWGGSVMVEWSVFTRDERLSLRKDWLNNLRVDYKPLHKHYAVQRSMFTVI